MQRSAGTAAAVARAAASAASEEEEDLRSNSNSSTASVVSSSSSLHLAHKQQQQQQQQQQQHQQQQLHHGGQLQQQQQQQQHETAARSSRKKKTKRDDLCDACKAKPAVWFCPADDAYLCHACDRSVHSANAFSLRHERVSLQVVNPVTAASIKEGDPPAEGRRDKMEVEDDDKDHSSSGKNKRPRRNLSSPSPICKNNRMLKALDEETTSPGPKNCSHGEKDREEAGDEEEEEELTHTVPVFVGDDDPARSIGEEEQQHSGIATDLGDSEEEEDEESDDAAYVDRFLNDDHQSGGEEVAAAARQERQRRHTRKKPRGDGKGNSTAGATCQDLNGLLGLRRSTLEDELHDDDDGDERFGFAIRKEQAIRAIPEFGLGMDGGDGIPDGRIKEEQQHYNAGLANDDFFLKPCRDATILGDILGLKLAGDGGGGGGGGYERDLRQIHTQHLQRRICLRLDYEDVLNAWSDRRPFLTDSSSAAVAAASARLFDDSTSDAAGSSDVGVVPDLSSAGSRRSGRPCAVEQPGRVPVVAPLLDGHAATAGGEAAAAATGAAAAAAAAASTESGGREARVSRYREKRRTRLFSKKIRYEVRKLNAERRPRLKGRFVKRLPVG